MRDVEVKSSCEIQRQHFGSKPILPNNPINCQGGKMLRSLSWVLFWSSYQPDARNYWIHLKLNLFHLLLSHFRALCLLWEAEGKKEVLTTSRSIPQAARSFQGYEFLTTSLAVQFWIEAVALTRVLLILICSCLAKLWRALKSTKTYLQTQEAETPLFLSALQSSASSSYRYKGIVLIKTTTIFPHTGQRKLSSHHWLQGEQFFSHAKVGTTYELWK